MPTPIVSIITRTRDRPRLLERACQSVNKQITSHAWEHCIVNDAGDPYPVKEVIKRFPAPSPNSRSSLSISISKGMEHASNTGINTTSAPFIAIHDDDDSWSPNFLEETVRFLSNPEHAAFGGVVVLSRHIVEQIQQDSVTEISNQPFNPNLKSIRFHDLLKENRFPPISFLFRRSLLDAIGPFDETLPVLGDWEFNLRALAHSPIAVLPAFLANYHHRQNTEDAYANSITAGDARHREVESILRSRWQQKRPFFPNANAFPAYSKLFAASTDLQRRLHALKNRCFSLPTSIHSKG